MDPSPHGVISDSHSTCTVQLQKVTCLKGWIHRAEAQLDLARTVARAPHGAGPMGEGLNSAGSDLQAASAEDA